MNKSGTRTVNPRLERNKLCSNEADWNLNGGGYAIDITSRTRGGSNAGQRQNARKKWFGDSDSESEVEPKEEEEEEEEEEADAVMMVEDDEPPQPEEDEEVIGNKKKTTNKPSASRAILEVEALAKAFAATKGCPKCCGPIDLLVKTVCIASSVILTCKDPTCTFVYHGDAASGTTLHVNNRDNFDRMTDYALNVKYVIAFLSCGDGSTEAARLLGFMGLPNDTTMETRSFSIIENRIAPLILELLEEILRDNLVEEVMLTRAASNADNADLDLFQLWKDSLVDPTLPINTQSYPVICGSFDMAWQKRGSNKCYNSKSGHGLMMGRYSRKAMALVVKSKTCNFCNAFRKKASNAGKVVGEHICCKNYEGSSGAMEADACLEIVTSLYQKKHVAIDRMCCDDDSSIRADCKWKNADYLKNHNTDKIPQVPISKGPNKGVLQDRLDHGKLPPDVPEPSFVSDPNHRRKQLTGELIKLDTANVPDRFTMTRMDTTRIGKNFGYMARTLHRMDESLYCISAQAVLEHHFDEHKYCGPWCRRKDETEATKAAGRKIYRNKENDAKLYSILQEKVGRYITKERLVEIAHGMDTNINEAFNNTATWFAPKNKTYCGSVSLQVRLSLAVGINSLGFEVYYQRLLKKLGVTLTEDVSHFLEVKQKKRGKRLIKIATNAAKKVRNHAKYAALKEDTRIARKERTGRNRRAGTYRSGMAMDDISEDEGQQQPKNNKKKKATNKRPSNKPRVPVICPHPFCRLRGHKTTKSTKCKANPERLVREGLEDACAAALIAGVPAVDPEEQRLLASLALIPTQPHDEKDADDLENNEHLGFDEDPSSDCEFFDCEESFDDDDEDIVDVGITRGIL
jgi:hypothetical protein